MGRYGVALALACVSALAGCSSSSGSGSNSVGQPDAMADTSMPRDGGGDSAADTSTADGTTAEGSAGDASQDAPLAGDAGPSLCPGTFIFCDGFEQNLTNWSSINSTGGTVAVDSVHVYRGAKALHLTIDPIVDAGTNAGAAVQKYETWPTHFFTRFFSYVPSPAPASTAALLDLIENGAPYAGAELRITPPSAGLEMQTYGTAAGVVTWDSTSASSALGQWVCFEVELDTVAGTAHVYMNDTEVTDLMRSGIGLPQLGNVSVGLGFHQPNAQGQIDTWIDEVAVNSARVGCAN